MYNVAIIIPTLNEELHIEECINSLRQQTYPFEEMDIMVADGGSTDKTCNIIESIHEKWPNVRLLYNAKKIQSCAFNLGIASSDAPVLIRLDAHATYHKDYIRLSVKHVLSDESIGNAGGRWIIKPYNDTLMAKANAILNYSRFGIGGSSFRVDMEAKETDSVPFGAFRRDVLEKVGGMREDLPRGEDNEFNSRIRKAGYRVWFDPDIVCNYYARPTLATSARQMYNNGVSIAWLWNIDRQSLGLRHLIPFLFVLSIPFTLGASFIFYMFVAILADIQLCCKYGWKYFLPLAALFPAIHLSYGWGTIKGFLSK